MTIIHPGYPRSLQSLQPSHSGSSQAEIKTPFLFHSTPRPHPHPPRLHPRMPPTNALPMRPPTTPLYTPNPIQHIQIHWRARTHTKSKVTATMRKHTIVSQIGRLHVKRHKVTAHRVEEIGTPTAQAHGLEIPERVVEVGREVGEGRHVHLVCVRGVDHGR